MAWHNRYINSISNAGLRLTIEIKRRDLLWKSPQPIINPHTGEEVSLPLRLSETISVSPNVLDILKRETALGEQLFQFHHCTSIIAKHINQTN